MKILIYGAQPDTHTNAVAWALRQKGATVDVWNQANFPALQTISVELDPLERAVAWSVEDFSIAASTVEYDLVWFRRPAGPTIASFVDERDAEMARRESAYLLNGFHPLLSENTAWVNEPAANKSASNKLYQLKQAMACGFKVPPTLISNHPDRIRAFVDRAGRAIYKPFYQANWKGYNSSKSLFTANVSASDLKDDDVLRACPGIYQQRVEKQYEVRLTLMGETAVGVKIGGYTNQLAELDWRSAGGELRFEQVDVPAAIISSSRRFLRQLGISFGCMDFIVSPDGEYFFLEINPAGQFLWIEEMLPEIPMLDLFSNFLLNIKVGAPAPATRVSMLDFAAAKEKNPALAFDDRHIAFTNTSVHRA